MTELVVRIELALGFALICSTLGCVADGLVTRTNRPTMVVRAVSGRLDELTSATHESDSSDNADSSKPKPDPSTKTKSSHSSSCSRCGHTPCTCDRNESSLSGQIAFSILGLPFTIPISLLNDNRDHYTEFPNYPYAEDVPGSLLIDSESGCKKQDWTGTLQGFAIPGTDHVDRYGARLVLDSGTRFGIDSEASYWFQKGPEGDTSQAWIGDANLTYRFAESEQTQMRAGVGINWLADQTRPEAGVNFTYGIEWFPRKPWTVASVIDLGSLGQGMLFHNRTTVGVMVGPAEAFVGYDYFQIDKVNVQGPVAGLGWRF